jgi:hypothetical protein
MAYRSPVQVMAVTSCEFFYFTQILSAQQTLSHEN